MKGIQTSHKAKLRLILAVLENAQNVMDVNFPGSRLHPLKGDRKGQWSVTVSGNWRITFRFEDGDAHIVNYEDYH